MLRKSCSFHFKLYEYRLPQNTDAGDQEITEQIFMQFYTVT